MIRLRELIERRRRRGLALLAVGLLVLVVVLAHLGPEEHEMASGGDTEMAASVCLAVIQGGGVLLLALTLIRIRRPRWSSRMAPARPVAVVPPRRPTGPARPRAGPVLQVFLS